MSLHDFSATPTRTSRKVLPSNSSHLTEGRRHMTLVHFVLEDQRAASALCVQSGLIKAPARRATTAAPASYSWVVATTRVALATRSDTTHRALLTRLCRPTARPVSTPMRLRSTSWLSADSSARRSRCACGAQQQTPGRAHRSECQICSIASCTVSDPSLFKTAHKRTSVLWTSQACNCGKCPTWVPDHVTSLTSIHIASATPSCVCS
jgi:hypothetical protein